MLDIGGFLTSVEFLSQFAGFISTIIGALFADLIAGIFGRGGA